jgi:glycosyltransferase involved in cell wall biosynthesis
LKVVIQSDSRIWGGNEKWLLLVGAGLAGRGHDVVVSCKPGCPVADEARARGLRITKQRPGADGDLPRALGFAALLRRERPNALLLSAFKRVFWGGWAGRRAGIPRIVERLGIEHDLPGRWKYQHAFRHYVDALIVNSANIRDRWLRSAPWFPADEVHVVLNGVQSSHSNESTLRAELGVSATAPIIAAAGRLEDRKGFDILLRALASADVPRAEIVICGDGPDESALRELAGALGIADRVHWVGFRRDLDNVLRGADIFALSSRREGMANVMLEAMAAGCLIVATDVSGVREAVGVVRGRSAAGAIVPAENVEEMARGLGHALWIVQNRGAEFDARREEIQYRVKHWFSPERTILETERVLAQPARKQQAP